MKNLQFNFNNEVDTFEIMQDEDGRIIVPGADGPLATYENLQQFAELYAQARDVKNENLKNWTLVENGNVVSFVLRAGTAGISAEAIPEDIVQVLDILRTNGSCHPLVVERVRQELAGSTDVMATLAMSDSPECAREIYDMLVERNAFVEPEVEAEPEEPVDVRSDVERFFDSILERDHSLAFFARMLNLETNTAKEVLVERFNAPTSIYTVDMLANLYEQAIAAARNHYGVDTRIEALMVLTQSVPYANDEDAKAKLINAANMARRDKVSVFLYEIGTNCIRKDHSLRTVMEVNGGDIYLFGNQPTQVIFNPEVDAEIEAERAEEDDEYDDEYDDEDTYEYDDEDSDY